MKSASAPSLRGSSLRCWSASSAAGDDELGALLEGDGGGAADAGQR
jgi:hypothetical protein